MRMITKGKFIGFLVWAAMVLLFWQGNAHLAWSCCSGKIGDFVWNDQNGNGCQDDGEPGISGVKVKLFKGCDTVFKETTTDESGSYEFTGLCAGNYEVEVVTPSCFEPTKNESSICDKTVDSNRSPASVTLTDCNPNDLTIDFGYVAALQIDKKCLVTPSPTDLECTDKIVATTLRYIGPTTILGATVEIDPDKSPTVVYSNANLVPNETILIDNAENGFTINALPDEGELGAKTKIRINGVEEVIHTSCSTPYVAGEPAPLDNPKGDPSPNWLVENFVDKDSNAIVVVPTLEFLDECTATLGINGDSGGAEVTYLYTVTNKGSDSLTNVTLVDKVDDTEVFGTGPFGLNKGETKEFFSKATLFETTTNTATVTAKTVCDTTCETSDSVTVTVTEPCNVCKGGTIELTFQYVGDESAEVVVYDDDNEAKPDKILFQQDTKVQPDDQFTITPRLGEDKLNNDISLYVNGEFNTKIHTSCSQPLFPGLIFGDFEVVEGRSKDNGLICPPDCAASPDASLEIKDRTVKWQITNNGITSLIVQSISVSWPQGNGALKKIKLDGDIFKDALLYPPPVTLPDDAEFVGTFKNREFEPGETRKLEFEFVNNASTDQSEYGITVEFFGEDEGCSLEFSPGAAPTICTTRVQAMRLRYTGQSISNATVEVDPDKSPTVVYSNVDLVPNETILIDNAENGFTINALPDENELGAKTKIRINGFNDNGDKVSIEEVIHTSCSTDFVAGKPAPLDDPKGDPSPNWEVENFVQKP